MKKRKTILWLFSLPLLAPLVIFGVRKYRESKPFHHQSGTFKTDKIGERLVLRTLSYYLQHETIPNRVSVGYWVSQPSGVHKGTSVYVLEYNRAHKTLIKHSYLPPHHSYETPDTSSVWEEVDEDDIHRVAAPVRAMQFLKEVEAYKGGNLSELKKHGARLQEPASKN